MEFYHMDILHSGEIQASSVNITQIMYTVLIKQFLIPQPLLASNPSEHPVSIIPRSLSMCPLYLAPTCK